MPPAERVPVLDGIRGVAIALVLAYHLDGAIRLTLMWTPCPLPRFLPLLAVVAGHTGVTLFFVLSAYLLAPPFLAEIGGGPRVDRRAWLLRRVRRIVPAHWVAIAVAALLVERDLGVWHRVWPAILYADLWTGERLEPYGGIWWSLSTEVQFYLLLPLLAALLRPGPRRSIGVATLVAAVAVFVAYVAGWGPFDFWARAALHGTLLAQAPAFAGGVIAATFVDVYGARVRAWLAATPWLRHAGNVLLVVLGTALLRLLAWVRATGIIGADLGTPAWRVPEAALWTAILLVIVLCPTAAGAVLVSASARRLGVLAYALYLTHIPVMVQGILISEAWWPGINGAWTLRTVPLAGAMLVTTGVAALALHRWVELPFMVGRRGTVR